MDPPTTDGLTAIELYVRSPAPRGGRSQLEGMITRIKRLESVGRIDECRVRIWGREAPSDATDAGDARGDAILGRLEEFRTWARRTGRSLGSFFEVRTVESAVTGETYPAIVLPLLAVAEYHDGDLDFVAPCADGADVHTVADRLDDLAAGTTHEAGSTGAGPTPLRTGE